MAIEEGVLDSDLYHSHKSDKITISMIDDILFDLAYEGKLYQPRPNYYKLMD